MTRAALLVAGVVAAAVLEAAADPQPNPPEWPKGVYIWGPETPDEEITSTVNDAFTTNGGHVPEDHGQFSALRFAFMFKPGTYHVDIPIGFYTQVLGLGDQPGDVVFEAPKGPYSEEGDQEHMGGALSSFWRGAENFQTRSSMLWAVSQAAPMRRVIVDKDLNLAQYVDGVGMGYASGGFLGNVQVGGKLYPGSQQQFCVRNGNFVGGWSGGVWNMVFIGSENAPQGHCGHDGGMPFVSVDETPVIAEKPFVSIDEQGKFFLNVPQSQSDRSGTDFDSGKKIPFEEVYVAQEGDTAAIINEQLKQGLHLLLGAAVWELEAPLELNTENQVVLGLGIATLVSINGNVLIKVGNVDGVRIAGVLLEAGETLSETLLQWGEDSTYKGSSDNPGYASDIFTRVGGPWDPAEKQQRSRLMVQLNSGNIVGDNFWLWRGDHWGKPTGEYGLVRNGDNRCDTGLEVNGDDITIYGLAVEHTLKDLVQWGGQGGRVYFFQSELPYDVNQDWGDAGYVGYRVLDNVLTHNAYGIGVYHFFRDYDVIVESGIACPEWLENSFESPLSVYLTGKGKVLHILNKRGEMTGDGSQVQWLCEKGPDVLVPANPPTTTARPRQRSPLIVKKKTSNADDDATGVSLAPVAVAPAPAATFLSPASVTPDPAVVSAPAPAANPLATAAVPASVSPPAPAAANVIPTATGPADTKTALAPADDGMAIAAITPATPAPEAGASPVQPAAAEQQQGDLADPVELPAGAEFTGRIKGSLTRPGYGDTPLNGKKTSYSMPWWLWVIAIQFCGLWSLCAYIYVLHRRCCGKGGSGDSSRVGGSPFLFQGLPSVSPGVPGTSRANASPQLGRTSGESPSALARWGTPEEKVRRTNSSKTTGSRDPGRAGSAQVAQAAPDDDDRSKERPGVLAGVAQALSKFGLALPATPVASPTPRSCRVAGSLESPIPEQA